VTWAVDAYGLGEGDRSPDDVAVDGEPTAAPPELVADADPDPTGEDDGWPGPIDEAPPLFHR
jgi:hypothetical protein